MRARVAPVGGTYLGRIDGHDQRLVRGWALNPASGEEPVTLEVDEGGRRVGTVRTSFPRSDLPEAVRPGSRPGFLYAVPPGCLDGAPHRLHFRFPATGAELPGSPVLVECREEGGEVPYETTSLLGIAPVLALAPHPDDESLACGGALAQHRRRGDAVKVVVLTDGGGGGPDGTSRSEAVARRAAECAEACRRLGIDDVESWGLPDRRLGVDAETVGRLARLLAGYRPALVYAPSPAEFHPDHEAASRLLREALRAVDLPVTVALWELNRPIAVNVLVDVTGVIEAKRAACDAYASQAEVLPYTDSVLGLNRYRALTVAPACGYAEGYLVLDDRAFAALPAERAASLYAGPGRARTTGEAESLGRRLAETEARLARIEASWSLRAGRGLAGLLPAGLRRAVRRLARGCHGSR